MYDVILTEASPTVLKRRLQTRDVINRMLAKSKIISIGEISRYVRDKNLNLSNEILDTVEEMETEGLIEMIKTNPQITYLRAARKVAEAVKPRKLFQLPNVGKPAPRPDHEIIHTRR